MNKQPMTLEQRIDAALRPDAAIMAADLAALIEEAEAVIAKGEKDWPIDQTLAREPSVVEAILAANRLRPRLPKLKARHQEVHNQERAAAWLATVPTHGQRCAGDWWKDNERRAAGQQAEQRRMADYYARTTREQEERENREARERFAESQRKKWEGS